LDYYNYKNNNHVANYGNKNINVSCFNARSLWIVSQHCITTV